MEIGNSPLDLKILWFFPLWLFVGRFLEKSLIYVFWIFQIVNFKLLQWKYFVTILTTETLAFFEFGKNFTTKNYSPINQILNNYAPLSYCAKMLLCF